MREDKDFKDVILATFDMIEFNTKNLEFSDHLLTLIKINYSNNKKTKIIENIKSNSIKIMTEDNKFDNK